MKEVIAIIRPDKLGQTKVALAKSGAMGLTIIGAEGRGKQKGQEGRNRATGGLRLYRSQGFVQKILLMTVVDDADVEELIGKIISINRTGETGDGKIIVCPVDESYRISTGESGNSVIV